ncbi:MAG: hypothetical protein JNG82_11195 [Opitutaceae bacterium]|nr:hypothetical protein [Opitutaceae bacterium]
MNAPQPRIPAPVWAMLLFALAWLAVVLAVRHLRPVGVPAAVAEVAALRADLAGLPADAERQLAEWRQAHPLESADRPAMAADEALGGPWVAAANLDAVTFRPAEPAAVHWTDIIAAVERLENLPGLTVQGIRIETTGSRTARQFGAVELTARIIPTLRPMNPVRRAEEPRAGPGSGRESAGLRETGSGPLPAVRPPPPPAIPAAGSVSRPGVASVPATLAPASDRFIPESQPPTH